MNNPIDYPIEISFDSDYGYDYNGEVSGSLDIHELEAIGGELNYFTIPEIYYNIDVDEKEKFVLEGEVINLDSPQNYVAVYADVTDHPYIQAVIRLKSDGSFSAKKSYLSENNPVIYLYKGSYDYLSEDYHVPSANDPKYICQTDVEPEGAQIITNYKIDLGVTTDHRYTITNAYLYSDGTFHGNIGYEGFKSAELINTETGVVISSNEMNKTGLVRSYCIDNADTTGHPNNPRQSWIYDDALAVIAYCASGKEGDITKARAILSGLEKLQLYPGELNFFYDVYSGSFYEYYILRSGAQSWVGCSITIYTETTGDRQFIPFAEKIANLLLSRQDQEIGSVKGGPDVTWYFTEHNIDIYYFLRDLAKLTGSTRYGEAAQQIKFALMTAHMNKETKTLNQGINDPALALDCSTWGGTFFNSIGETAIADRSYDHAMKFEVTDTMPLSFEQKTWNSLYTTDAELTGFRTYLPGNGSYLDSPKTIWSEGTMGAVTLGLRRGREIDTYLESMCEMQEADPKGGLVYMNRSYIPYPYEFHVWPSVAGTAWLYFTMVAPELLWAADDLVTGSIQLEDQEVGFYAVPYMNSISDTDSGKIRYSRDGRNWGSWEPAVEKELDLEFLSKPFFYQFKLGTEISSIYVYGNFDGELPDADKICRTAGLVYENDSSNYRFFKVKATSVKYLDGSRPESVYFNINADNGGGVEMEFKATPIEGTNDWEATIPRSHFNNALGKYWIWCGAEKNFPTLGVERTKVHLESHDITKAAIIIVPDIIASRLAYDGRKIWDPNAIEVLTIFSSTMKPFLYCDEQGNSVYDVEAIQDNQGARNTYDQLYQSLLQEYDSDFEVKFFAYDWRLDGTDIAWQLDEYAKSYKHIHLVAHGLGGLISTKYMSLSEANLNKVLSLTAIGTPFTGTVDAPFVLQTGNMMDNIIENLFMSKHVRDLAANYPSAYQFLPTRRYGEEYLYVLNDDTNELTSGLTFNEKMEQFESLPWGEGKRSLMKGNSTFHDSLMENGEHLANKYKDKVYYIAGYGSNTINGYIIQADKDSQGVYNGAMINYTKEGDGVVPLHSATNNDGTNKTLLVNANHTELLSSSSTISYVKNIIRNSMNSTTRSNVPAIQGKAAVDKRKLSVLVMSSDKLEICDMAGNQVSVDKGTLYIEQNGVKKETGTTWTFDDKRTQYALNPDTTYQFKFSSNDGILKSTLTVLDLESLEILGMRVHNLTGKTSPQTVTVSYEELLYVIPYPKELDEELAPFEEFILFVEQLEDAYKSFKGRENPSDAKEISPIKEVLYLLKHYNYNEIEWQLVFGTHQEDFYQYLSTEHYKLLEEMDKYINGDQPTLFSDGNNGVLDIAHLAATTIAYTYGVSALMSVPWTGWAGDLITFMGDVKRHLAADENKGDDPQIASDAFLGTAPYHFNYADICTDADAIKIAQMIKSADAHDEHGLSNILKEYYANHTNDRMHYYLEDMGIVKASVVEIYKYLVNYMAAIPQQAAILFLNKESISSDIKKACCRTFAKYIYAAIKK